MITGVFPYNAQFTSDGKFGIVNNNGAAGSADGQADTVAVIDMMLDSRRVIDQVTVGDAPDGLAVNPTAGYAIPLLTNGAGNVPKNAFFHHDHAIAVLLKSDGKTMRNVGQTEVGTLSEVIAFSPEGRFVYIGTWGEQNLVTLRLEGDKLVPVGTPLKLPGHRCRCAAARPNAWRSAALRFQRRYRRNRQHGRERKGRATSRRAGDGEITAHAFGQSFDDA